MMKTDRFAGYQPPHVQIYSPQSSPAAMSETPQYYQKFEKKSTISGKKNHHDGKRARNISNFRLKRIKVGGGPT